MSRCHGWCFTEFDTEREPVFDESVHEYLIFGREIAPDTGRSHFQGYIWFKERKRFAGVKKALGNCHIEPAKGTPEQNKKYCSKDGDFKEYGRLPSIKRGGGAFKDVLVAAERGEISKIKEEYPGLYIRYKTNILSSIAFRTDELENSCGVWICGPPRCGKDASVRKLGNVYVKSLNKWWDGYKNEKYVLISDVEPDHGKWLGYFLKIWSDRYAFNAEIKGSSMLIRPLKIFVTSNFKMCEVFQGEILSALETRFNVYDEFENTFTERKRALLKLDIYDKLLLHEDVSLEKEVVPSVAEKENISSSEEFEEEKNSKKKKRLSKDSVKKRRGLHW
ncbi:replication-associated protein [Trichonephila clavata]|uniref:ATP-dependent helicase Rep n=1 Tax=Trichonephila clavata TaxID=2740835 RepID=A0A8X6LS10_TRICU|nr:replication-associated protein [Trichonephila clavata]